MERTITAKTIDEVSIIFGNLDSNLKIIENKLGVKIIYRGTDIKITGFDDNVDKCQKVIESLFAFCKSGEEIDEIKVNYVISMVDEGKENIATDLQGDGILISTKGRLVKPKTLGQKNYVKAISKNTVVLGVGPAGTGKTYLAVALAVKAFKNKEVNRIILTRPAVEAGEKLGFLPGDLQSKVDPYLRPLYDALYEMLGMENYQKQVEKGNIEVAPLAYMRGRTLDDSFIILDEAQNTTPEQMKMFLTRIGFNSKAVITGDVTQIDLPDGKRSGLVEAMKVLKDIEGISITKFNEKDVVRHPLVQEIIKAYERYDNMKKKKAEKR